MKQKLLKKENRVTKNNQHYSDLYNVIVFVFLLLLPTQLGRHFFLPFSYLSGIRIDYLAPTIYLTDVLVILLIVFNYKRVFNFFKNKKLLFVLGLLLVNVVFSLSSYISIYRYIKILEFLSLFAIFSSGETRRPVFFAFLTGGLFELILSLLQLANKHSIQGIFYYFGERYFTLSIPGIAKAVISGTEFLRPYGTFSHPNSLAGFYLLIYFFTLTNKKITNLFLKYSLLLVSSILIFISFSKAAILTLLLLTTIYYLLSTKKSCRLCLLSKLITLTVVGLIFISAQTDPLSLQKRLDLVQNSLEIFIKHPVFGVGLGSYLVAQNQFPIKYSYFFLQPVHNIFLLFLTETGIIIFSVVGWFFIKISPLFRRDVINHASTIFIALVILITGSFDHYWLTLQQNYLLMAVLFGFSSSVSQFKKLKQI